MTANVARDLKPVDALEVQVLVDNVTDSLSTVPKGVTNEVGVTNVLKDARNVCGDVPLWAVMGDFYLLGQQIEEIVADIWADSIREVGAFFSKHVMPAKN